MDLYTFENAVDIAVPAWSDPIDEPAARCAVNVLRDRSCSFQPSLTLSQSARAVMRLPTSPSQAVNDAMASLVANLWELPSRKVDAMWILYSRDDDHYPPLARYAPEFYRPGTIIEAVEILEQNGLVEHHQTVPPPNAAHRPRVQSTSKLLVSMNDVEGPPWIYMPHEVIVLRGADGTPQPYCETPAASDMRGDVLAHNAFLSTFSITVEHPDAGYASDGVLVVETADGDRYINPSRRDYYRVFNGSFDRGGWWSGPWWHLLPSRVREGIRINGETISKLDIRGFHLRLLCSCPGMRGRDPFDGLRWPLWNTVYGFRLRYIAAEVYAHVQRRLRADAIPCLSFHASFVVPRSAHDRIVAVMNEEFDRACARLRAAS